MNDSTEICLLITSGNGPGECQQAVAGVLQRMQDDADAAGLDLDATTTPTRHGLKSAVVVLHGAGAAAFAARRRQGRLRVWAEAARSRFERIGRAPSSR